MRLSDCHAALIQDLTAPYGEGEAISLARIVFEDVFFWRSGQPERELRAEEYARFLSIQKRLLGGEPLQYVLGQADFFGLKLQVGPGVLIPRQETEELVSWLLSTARQMDLDEGQVLDIGTGSGCIALACKKKLPKARVEAMDVSTEALEIARLNAQKLDLDIHFWQADILSVAAQTESEEPSYDLIVSNPPYIPYQESKLMPKHVLAHEPALALFVAQPDPLIFYRRIMQFASHRLRPGGWLFFECNEFNAQELLQLAEASPFTHTSIRQDLSGKDRMWRGQKR